MTAQDMLSIVQAILDALPKQTPIPEQSSNAEVVALLETMFLVSY